MDFFVCDALMSFAEWIVKGKLRFVFQVASLFASYILGYLAAAKMQSILVTHMVQ